MSVVSDLLSFFESTQKSIEKSNARIVEKYPKFLSKLALFKLQMDDSVFRETFMVQIMIFTQAIADPVGMEQKNLFKLTKEETKLAEKLSKQAANLLTDQTSQNDTKVKTNKKQADSLGKRTFGESLTHIVQKNEP